MKRADFRNIKKNRFFLISGICFFLLLIAGCGLEEFPVLEQPSSVSGETSYLSSDYTKRYFSFRTSEANNSASSTLNFRGTEVYYKIYNNLSTMASAQNAINTLNTSTNSTAAATAIKETYAYKTLKLSEGSITPLIRSKGHTQYVYIRLTDYNDEMFRSAICVNSENESIEMYKDEYSLQYEGKKVYPRRSFDSKYTFNFGGENTETDKVPKEGDEDVNWSSTPTEQGKWYIDVYAVSVAMNTTTWTEYYSTVLHLGSITIVEGENN